MIRFYLTRRISLDFHPAELLVLGGILLGVYAWHNLAAIFGG